MRKLRSGAQTSELQAVKVVPIDGARQLVLIGPAHWVWSAGDESLRKWVQDTKQSGSIVWVTAPRGQDATAVVSLLKSAGVVARIVPGTAAPAAVSEQEAAAPAPARSELRSVVMELAGAAEADFPGVAAVCDETLSAGGL